MRGSGAHTPVPALRAPTARRFPTIRVRYLTTTNMIAAWDKSLHFESGRPGKIQDPRGAHGSAASITPNSQTERSGLRAQPATAPDVCMGTRARSRTHSLRGEVIPLHK